MKSAIYTLKMQLAELEKAANHYALPDDYMRDADTIKQQIEEHKRAIELLEKQH